MVREHWVEFPVLYGRSLLASHSTDLSVHMPIPNPRSISPRPKRRANLSNQSSRRREKRWKRRNCQRDRWPWVTCEGPFLFYFSKRSFFQQVFGLRGGSGIFLAGKFSPTPHPLMQARAGVSARGAKPEKAEVIRMPLRLVLVMSTPGFCLGFLVLQHPTPNSLPLPIPILQHNKTSGSQNSR